ncbi:MAG: RNA methyltransferase [Bacteroidales bacterium]|nr:RNA methyltransferase [Bacteroidales bacterium]
MLSKNQIKHINSLKIGKFRRIFKQFLLEGKKSVYDLLNSDFEIIEIYALKYWIDENIVILENKKIEFQEINEKELSRISSQKTPNDVIAIVKIPINEIIPKNIFSGLCLVLDEIKDPGNLGTIIRTADWFGIENIICSKNSVDVYNPKVVQATMGSITRVKVYYTQLSDFLSSKPSETKIFGTMLEGENIYKTELIENAIILIGNESQGISSELLPMIDEKISIPKGSKNFQSQAESLNASIATAIICSEFQRRKI